MKEKEHIEEEEIDLIELIKTVWAGRRTVFKFVLVFGVVGLFIALFSPKEYTATTVMVPTVAGKGSGGSIGGLAAMAGISLGGGAAESGVIPPTLYPKIVNNVPFKKIMLDTELEISHLEQPVTFRKYYEDIYSGGVFSTVKKYTIGLPGLIIGAIRGKGDGKEVSVREDSLFYVTAEEKRLFDILNNGLSVEVNDKEGYVSLSAKMPEALAAAQLAKKAQYLLQTYIIDFKSKKAKEQLEFIEGRLKEKEREFRKAELALAQFQDRNRNVATATARTQEQHLQSEYNLAFGIYSELAKQVENQKIKVKEDTPVFTIIEPVSVPVEKSKPKRAMILAIWLFLGVVVGVGMVFGREWIGKLKEEKRI